MNNKRTGKAVAFSNILKLLATGVMFWLILKQVHWSELLPTLRSAQPVLLTIALIVFFARNWVSAFRWQALVSAREDQSIRFSDLLRFYLASNFLGFFLPSSIGGDIPRAYFLNRKIQNLQECISSIILERVLGVLAMIIMAYVALFIGVGRVAKEYFWLVAGLSVVVIGFVVMLFFLPIPRWLGMTGLNARWITRLIKLFESFQGYRTHPQSVWTAFTASLVFQGMAIVSTYFLGLALNQHVPFYYYLLFIPLIWIISLLPISLNGLGARETSFVVLFSLAGMPTDVAAVISILNLFFLVIQGLFGAVVFILDRDMRIDFSRATQDAVSSKINGSS